MSSHHFRETFNDARKQPPGDARSQACDSLCRNILPELRRNQRTLFGQLWPHIAMHLHPRCSPSEGHRALALLFLFPPPPPSGDDKPDVPFIPPLSDAIWAAVLANLVAVDEAPSAALATPNFLANLARQVVRGRVVADTLTHAQLVALHRVLDALVTLTAAPDAPDAQKWRDWLQAVTPLVAARVRGPTASSVRGCIIGQAVGDSVGFHFEGKGRETCEMFANELAAGNWPKSGKSERYTAGQYTDDSQLMRELVISLVEHAGSLDAADYAQRVFAMFDESGPTGRALIVGMGYTTQSSALMSGSGVAPTRAGHPWASGNGGAMRAAPVGLFEWSDVVALRSVAAAQCEVTHSSSRAKAGAVAIAGAARLASLTPVGRLEVTPFCAAVATLVAPVDCGVALAIYALTGVVERSQAAGGSNIDDAHRAIVAAGMANGDSSWGEGKCISSSVVQATLWALFSFLRPQPCNYVQTLLLSIRGGGDIDTTAAMACALAGAHLGVEQVPAHLVARVNDCGKWTAADLEALADRAHAVVGAKVAAGAPTTASASVLASTAASADKGKDRRS